MSEVSNPSENPEVKSDKSSVTRLVYVMLWILAFGTLGIWFFADMRNALGFLFGGLIAFVNLYWIRATLHSVFEKITEDGGSRISILRHSLRYAALGAIIFGVYQTELVPITPVFFGLAIFAFAVVFEGVFQLISTFFRHEES